MRLELVQGKVVRYPKRFWFPKWLSMRVFKGPLHRLFFRTEIVISDPFKDVNI